MTEYIEFGFQAGVIVGTQGENLARGIKIPVQDWIDQYGEGSFNMIHRRAGETVPYVATTVLEEGVLFWPFTNVDTGKIGRGIAELRYSVNSVLVKSVTFETRVLATVEEQTTPDPYTSWLNTLTALANTTTQNAAAAAESAEDAADSAEDAGEARDETVQAAEEIAGALSHHNNDPEAHKPLFDQKVSEAPNDGSIYGRLNNSWAVVPGGAPGQSGDPNAIHYYNETKTEDQKKCGRQNIDAGAHFTVEGLPAAPEDRAVYFIKEPNMPATTTRVEKSYSDTGVIYWKMNPDTIEELGFDVEIDRETETIKIYADGVLVETDPIIAITSEDLELEAIVECDPTDPDCAGYWDKRSKRSIPLDKEWHYIFLKAGANPITKNYETLSFTVGDWSKTCAQSSYTSACFELVMNDEPEDPGMVYCGVDDADICLDTRFKHSQYTPSSYNQAYCSLANGSCIAEAHVYADNGWMQIPIGTFGSGIPGTQDLNSVHYYTETRTESQKARARGNIGAAAAMPTVTVAASQYSASDNQITFTPEQATILENQELPEVYLDLTATAIANNYKMIFRRDYESDTSGDNVIAFTAILNFQGRYIDVIRMGYTKETDKGVLLSYAMNPTSKTTAMTQAVGIDSLGRLWTEAATIPTVTVAEAQIVDDVITFTAEQKAILENTNYSTVKIDMTAAANPLFQRIYNFSRSAYGGIGTNTVFETNFSFSKAIGSLKITYDPSVGKGAITLGLISPESKTTAMTQTVGVDDFGKLWTEPGGGGGGGGTDTNAVHYNAADGKTDTEKQQARTNIGAGTYSKPSDGIPASDLTAAARTSLGKADTAVQPESGKGLFSGSYTDLTNKPTIPSEVTETTVSGWGFTKNTGTYSKPSDGIPSSDMTEAVRTSLGKADSAIQSHQDISGKQDKMATITVAASQYSSAADTITFTTAQRDILINEDNPLVRIDLTSTGYSYAVGVFVFKRMKKRTYGSTNYYAFSAEIDVKEGKHETVSLQCASDSMEGSLHRYVISPDPADSTMTQMVGTDADGKLWTAPGGGGGADTNAVHYNAADSKTDTEKAQARTNIGAGTYSKPSDGIPSYDMTEAVRTSLGKADTAVQPESGKGLFSGSYNDLTEKPTIPSEVTETTVSGWGFTKNTGTYSKPSDGIPSSDMTEAVRTSLGKADTALQSHQDITGKQDATDNNLQTTAKTVVGAINELDSAVDGKLSDAPSDSKTYGRKNGAWSEITGGGGGTDSNAVHYNAADSKTESEKLQARTNIGAAAAMPTITVAAAQYADNQITFTSAQAAILENQEIPEVYLDLTATGFANNYKMIFRRDYEAESSGNHVILFTAVLTFQGREIFAIRMGYTKETDIGVLGGYAMNPTSKTSDMTQAVGIDSLGRLWTAPGGSGGPEEDNFTIVKDANNKLKTVFGGGRTETAIWITRAEDEFGNYIPSGTIPIIPMDVIQWNYWSMGKEDFVPGTVVQMEFDLRGDLFTVEQAVSNIAIPGQSFSLPGISFTRDGETWYFCSVTDYNLGFLMMSTGGVSSTGNYVVASAKTKQTSVAITKADNDYFNYDGRMFELVTGSKELTLKYKFGTWNDPQTIKFLNYEGAGEEKTTTTVKITDINRGDLPGAVLNEGRLTLKFLGPGFAQNTLGVFYAGATSGDYYFIPVSADPSLLGVTRIDWFAADPTHALLTVDPALIDLGTTTGISAELETEIMVQVDHKIAAKYLTLDAKQDVTDNSLQTTSKTVVGAINELQSGKLEEAPSDGNEYVRKNKAWVVSSGGGGGGTDSNAVHYNAADGKTEAQKLQARTNIGAMQAPVAESYTVTAAQWSAISGYGIYEWAATVTATHTVGADTVCELINDNAVSFATYGFAIGAVSGQTLTLYAITKPSASVTLEVDYYG